MAKDMKPGKSKDLMIELSKTLKQAAKEGWDEE